MVVPTYQDGKTDEYFNLNVEENEEAVDTRKAGKSYFRFRIIFLYIVKRERPQKTVAERIQECENRKINK